MIIKVKVKPNSKEQKIVKIGHNDYLVYLKSAPEDNKANIELINLLKNKFNKPANKVKMKSGFKSRKNKLIEIED